MNMRRLWHMIVGHDWRILLVDERRSTIHAQHNSLAGAFATCPCGASHDDLSDEAAAHFIRTGRLTLNFKTGEYEVTT